MLGFTRFQISLGFWVSKATIAERLTSLNFGGGGGGGGVVLA